MYIHTFTKLHSSKSLAVLLLWVEQQKIWTTVDLS